MASKLVALKAGRLSERKLVEEIERLALKLKRLLAAYASPELTQMKLHVLRKLKEHTAELGTIIEKRRYQ